MNHAVDIANAVRIPIRDLNDRHVRLDNYRGKQHLLVVLMRGLW